MANAISEAFRLGNLIRNGRDGAGFLFKVETISGNVVQGPPPDDDDLNQNDRDFIVIDNHNGNFVVIPLRSINLIDVVEC